MHCIPVEMAAIMVILMVSGGFFAKCMHFYRSCFSFLTFYVVRISSHGNALSHVVPRNVVNSTQPSPAHIGTANSSR